ncbi:hypothetical protein VTO42DRAFT_3563 [Malbranchea cinnamomea]
MQNAVTTRSCADMRIKFSCPALHSCFLNQCCWQRCFITCYSSDCYNSSHFAKKKSSSSISQCLVYCGRGFVQRCFSFHSAQLVFCNFFVSLLISFILKILFEVFSGKHDFIKPQS